MSSTQQADRTTIIRSRDGGFFRVPLDQISEFVLPEGTVVIQWRPGRYLAIPAERLSEYQMSDADLVQVFMDSSTRPRLGSRPSRTGGRRRFRRNR
jgi:hypothetical protein